MAFGKRNEKAKGIAIACNSVRTGIALPYQSFREIGLQYRGKTRFGGRDHLAPPSERCQRRAASCKSSGAAERYQ